MGKLKLKKHEVKYGLKYTEFVTHSKQIWLNVLLHREVRKYLKTQCDDDSYRDGIVVEHESPVGLGLVDDISPKPTHRPIRLTGQNLLDFVNSNKRGGTEWMLEWSLVSAIGLFETFVSDIAKMAYLEYPEDLIIDNKGVGATERENHKVLEMLVYSQTKEEALEKYVEEKLRSIFYGKPTDVFFTGKDGKSDGKLRLSTAKMADSCQVELDEYMEIVGRRNAIVHNVGKVDAKYVRETQPLQTKNKLSGGVGEKVKVNEDYLFNVLNVLDKLASEYTKLVLQRIGGIKKREQGDH